MRTLSAQELPSPEYFQRQSGRVAAEQGLWSQAAGLTVGASLLEQSLPARFGEGVPHASKPTRALAADLAPVRVMMKLQGFWGLTNEEMLRVCGLPADNADPLPQALAKHFKLDDVKTRLTSIMAIRARLSAMFGGDAARERRWLETPWARLENRAPIALLMSGDISNTFAVESSIREFAGG